MFHLFKLYGLIMHFLELHIQYNLGIILNQTQYRYQHYCETKCFHFQTFKTTEFFNLRHYFLSNNLYL